MKLLFDTDAFCKLGAAGLLNEAVGTFSIDLDACGRLPALPHMLKKGKLRQTYGGEICESLIPTAMTMSSMSEPSGQWLDKLTPIHDIDPGEAQIFALAAENDVVVLTGDKRALRALKDIDGFADVLAGRIVTMEAIIISLCKQLGSEEIRQRIAPLAVLDTMLAICFSSGNPDPIEGLTSYLNELSAELEPLIIWEP